MKLITSLDVSKKLNLKLSQFHDMYFRSDENFPEALSFGKNLRWIEDEVDAYLDWKISNRKQTNIVTIATKSA